MNQEELDKAAREAVRKLQEHRVQWIPMLDEIAAMCTDENVPPSALELMGRIVEYAQTAEHATLALIKAHIADLQRRSGKTS